MGTDYRYPYAIISTDREGGWLIKGEERVYVCLCECLCVSLCICMFVCVCLGVFVCMKERERGG